ncbi:MAG: HAD family phosphatase [Lachnospiraceae bacterium]|nr:HAD family phosphatase [Lachnospiraceae bacterium]
MLKGKEAVIFDLDGTLVDSMWMWKDIDIEFLAERGIDLPPNLQKEIEGMSLRETAQYFIDTFHLTETIDELKVIWNDMAYDKYAHVVRPKPGAIRFLDRAREKGIKLGIASSNSIELIMAAVSNYDLNGHFDVIVSANEVPRGKPYPDVYLEVAKRLGVEPSKCLVFEDIPMGIMAGKSAGMTVCAIEDDYSADVVDEKKELADYYIISYDEVE